MRPPPVEVPYADTPGSSALSHSYPYYQTEWGIRRVDPNRDGDLTATVSQQGSIGGYPIYEPVNFVPDGTADVSGNTNFFGAPDNQYNSLFLGEVVEPALPVSNTMNPNNPTSPTSDQYKNCILQ